MSPDHLVRDINLTSALWQLLDAIDRADGPIPVANIARNMGLTRQSVQRAADILVERGFVAFRDNPHHRRAKLVALTIGGVTVLRRANERQLACPHSVAHVRS